MRLKSSEKKLLKQLVAAAIERPFHFSELVKFDHACPRPGVDMTDHCGMVAIFHVVYTHKYQRPDVMCRHASFLPMAALEGKYEPLIPMVLAELGFEECQPDRTLYWFTKLNAGNVLHILEPDGGNWDALKSDIPSVQ